MKGGSHLLTNRLHKIEKWANVIAGQSVDLMRAFNGINGNMCRQYFSGLFLQCDNYHCDVIRRANALGARTNQGGIIQEDILFCVAFYQHHHHRHIAMDRRKRRIKQIERAPSTMKNDNNSGGRHTMQKKNNFIKSYKSVTCCANCFDWLNIFVIHWYLGRVFCFY